MKENMRITYEIELRGYIITTESFTKHKELLEYLRLYCKDDCYIDLPDSKRLEIESNYRVRTVYNNMEGYFIGKFKGLPPETQSPQSTEV